MTLYDIMTVQYRHNNSKAMYRPLSQSEGQLKAPLETTECQKQRHETHSGTTRYSVKFYIVFIYLEKGDFVDYKIKHRCLNDDFDDTYILVLSVSHNSYK